MAGDNRDDKIVLQRILRAVECKGTRKNCLLNIGPDWPDTCYISQAGLKLMAIFLL